MLPSVLPHLSAAAAAAVVMTLFLCFFFFYFFPCVTLDLKLGVASDLLYISFFFFIDHTDFSVFYDCFVGRTCKILYYSFIFIL